MFRDDWKAPTVEERGIKRERGIGREGETDERLSGPLAAQSAKTTAAIE